MASALFKLSSNGGSSYAAAGTAFADASALAYNASGTYSIKAALDSTAGVDSVAWAITSADDAHIASLPAVTSNADKTCTFSVPKTGGAWLLQCTVNGGVNPRTGKADPSLTRALAIKVLNSVGNQEVAVGESTEAGTYGWTKAFNDIARASGGGGGGGGNASLRQVYWDEGNLSPADPVYATFSTAFTAATALLSEANGPVEIVVLDDNDPPVFPSGTYDCQNLIEVVGSPAARGARIAATLTSGFVLRNPRALRNLDLDINGMAAPWLDTSAATDLALVLDNTRIVDNTAGADMCTLAASTTGNKLQLINGASYTGDSYAFATLASGKVINVYLDSGVLNAESFHGSAGSVAVYQGPDGSFDTQASFSGTLSVTSAVVTALGQAPTNVSFNSVRLTNVASPTSGTDAANRTFTLQQGCDLIYDEGGTAGPRTFTTLAAAVTAAASIPGKVRIGIKTTSGTPTTTGVTYALDRRIELVGLQPTGTFGQVTLTMVASAVFQNACAFRNLSIEHDLATAWLTASTGGIVCEFDNVAFVDNGAGADICTLNASSTNFLRFTNGSSFSNGGGGYLCTLSAGKTLYLTLAGNSAIGDDVISGVAGTLNVTQGGGSTFGNQSAFSGTQNLTQQHLAALAQSASAVNVNAQRVSNVGAPSSDTDAVTKRYHDGSTTWSIAGSGNKDFSASAAIGYGFVELTGLLTGDVTITASGVSQAVWFRRNTTGDYTVKITNSTPAPYLAPGQVRRVCLVSGTAYCEGSRVMEYDSTSLNLSSGYAVGTYDVTLLKVPAAFDVDRVEIRCETSVSGGTITVAVGVSGSYDQLVTATSIGTAGDVVGLDTTHAGSDFSGKIAAHYSSAQTIKLRIVVSGGTLSAGALRVLLVGRCVEG